MLVPTIITKSNTVPYLIPSWSSGTDAEIIEALNKHYSGDIDIYDYWTVGDERKVKLSAMPATDYLDETHVEQTVTLVLSKYGGKMLADNGAECVFQVDQKNCLLEKGVMNPLTPSFPTPSNGTWESTARRTWCNEVYYNAIPKTLRPIFKRFINASGWGNGISGLDESTDLFALRATSELIFTVTQGTSGENMSGDYDSSPYSHNASWYGGDYYDTRIHCRKYIGGELAEWWNRGPAKDNATDFCAVITYGEPDDVTAGERAANMELGIAPFGVI